MPSASKPDESRVTVENVMSPGRTFTVDAKKYGAMKRALLSVLPKKAPGLTQAEMRSAVLAHLPEAEFPGVSQLRIYFSICGQTISHSIENVKDLSDYFIC